MATVLPLVIKNGQIQQLQSGDSLQNIELPQLTNSNAAALVIGTTVYSIGNDTVDKALGSALATSYPIGLMQPTSTATATLGGVQMQGVLAATTAQWDAVAGTTGGLTKNVIYYLSAAVAGSLTSVAPSTPGQYVVQVGQAISTTELKIDIKPSILL